MKLFTTKLLFYLIFATFNYAVIISLTSITVTYGRALSSVVIRRLYRSLCSSGRRVTLTLRSAAVMLTTLIP